jgi:hypothetical protein
MSARNLLRFAPLCVSFLLASCLDHPIKGVQYDKFTVDDEVFPIAVNKDVDILFVIDNSGSMAEEQALLTANFAAFIDVLEADDVKANYRIGITTTDSGNPRCPSAKYTPEGGRLVLSSCIDRVAQGEFTLVEEDFSFACDDFCGKADADVEIKPTTTALDPEAKPRRWLESIEGQTNVKGFDSMVEAFQCYGPQGVAGCGFESHLESMYLSLASASDKSSTSNYGFIRDTAILSVVVISDEVDCSFNPATKDIFMTNKVFWNDPANDPAPSSAVCWNAGVRCEGAGPSYTDCRAENFDAEGNPGAADADAVLQPIRKYVDFLQSIEDAKREIDPTQEVLVSMIAGVPVGYEEGKAPLVYEDSADAKFQADFGIGPGCILPSGDPNIPDQTAIPPVRERQFAEAFEVDGERNLYSICQPNYSDALDAIAEKIRDQIQPACMPSCVLDTDVSTPVLEPNCQLFEVKLSDESRTGIPRCQEVNGEWVAPAGATVCFGERVDPDGTLTPSKLDDMSEECTDGGLNLEFFLVRSAAAPAGTTVTATCQLSDNKPRDCPGL